MVGEAERTNQNLIRDPRPERREATPLLGGRTAEWLSRAPAQHPGGGGEAA